MEFRRHNFNHLALFDSFTEDNDPHGEHDFGAFEHEGQRIFWKIDYYAPDMEHGSENPADPKQTVRVLTIILASESIRPRRLTPATDSVLLYVMLPFSLLGKKPKFEAAPPR
jgi:Protein of unknown function (DUF3768)